MDTQRYILATVVGGVTLFILGFLTYGLTLVDFFAANSAPGIMKETPIFWSIGLGELLLAGLLTLTLGCWAGVKSIGEGLKSGALFGILLSLAVGMTLYGATNMSNFTATLVDVLVNTVRVALAGAVIGAVLASSTQQETASAE
jgi:hypothetical protein